MWRLLAAALMLTFASPAVAAPPTVNVQASTLSGAVPLTVTLSAHGDAAGYRWELGDGATAEGPTAQHTYGAPGRYAVTLTATASTGETTVSRLTITASRLLLTAPRSSRYGEPLRFRGRLLPAVAGARVTLLRHNRPVALLRTRRDGSFAVRTRVRQAGAYTARSRGIVSSQHRVWMRPRLDVRLSGSRTLGSPLRLSARLLPASAGRLDVRIWRGARPTHARLHGPLVRLRLGTGAPALYRIRVVSVPAKAYAPVRRRLSAAVVQPELGLGARGPSVLALEQRLQALRYALPRVDRTYALDTYEAVLTFQKVHGLPWTGRVDRRVWHALARARTPTPRYRGSHIEISKGRQFLLAVRGGRVAAAVHISTGATGNTPLGRFSVYRKVPGWDWVLWYPLYFLRGFAVHGYPFVPAYPASHGCVRVPMWIAPRLYAWNPHGATVYVYP
jgi:PKD repeat protein